jgi:nitric oxide reductase subunit B
MSTSNSDNNWWQYWVMKPSNWWLPLLAVAAIGFTSMLFVGGKTYIDAPPIASFYGPEGRMVVAKEAITRGQVLFLKNALMDYGTLFGDGAGRGPDFTAEALHRTALAMEAFYLHRQGGISTQFQRDGVRAMVQRDIKTNGYKPEEDRIEISAAQVHGYYQLVDYYKTYLRNDAAQILPSLKNLTDDEIADITAFFFWGGWVCGAERPGQSYSYTNNWPYDPDAGNLPPATIVIWSVVAILGLFLVLGVVLFLHGRFAQLVGWRSRSEDGPVTRVLVNQFQPGPMQQATYPFFLAAGLLFVLQVFAGVLTVHNFLGLEVLFGIPVNEIISLAAARGWHLQLALLWITACWVGVSFFLLEQSYPQQGASQVKRVKFLFWLFVVMVVGNLIGVLFGPLGVMGDHWNLLGNQGWEFVELGKLWQGVLMFILAFWSYILYRGIKPHWERKSAWLLPNWLFYCVLAVSLLFLSGFVATPETNFVIADFWRWAVIHMWAEAFFEVFATIVVAYTMFLMGFISHQGASRVVYIATLLFLGSGLLGISHNFYWNAKPVATLAIGSIFSTLQVVPLLLLSLEAWQFRKLPSDGGSTDFGQAEAFLFLLGVNFWNFLGAGVFGFLINLPIVNYYEHGTYLTVNHGHAALMGVYGNLSLAAMVFCTRYLVRPEAWPTALVRRAFWAINIGLMLMVLLDLLPVGFHQLQVVMEQGYAAARAEQYIQSDVFQMLTWARIIGGLTFVLGGVLPIAWFLLTRFGARKAEQG